MWTPISDARHPTSEACRRYSRRGDPLFCDFRESFSSFWNELDAVIESIERNPRSHHYESCGLRRANMKRFPYHLLYEVNEDTIFMVVFRHDRRHPSFGIKRRI
jgi:hypothetical protein